MASSKVTFTDNSQEVLAELSEKIEVACEAIGGQGEMYAKEDCP